MDLSAALRSFVRTVEKGSLSAAARDLGISQPAVTKHIRNLEQHVNARLLERTSRAVRPTAHGLRLYETSHIALASIDAAVEGVRRDMGRIEGLLRIHAPSCIGARHLHRIVMEFQDAHPDVFVDLMLDNVDDRRSVDLVYENFDLAVTYGRPSAQEIILRRIGFSKRILVASPDYLKRHGPIKSPQALSRCAMVTTTRNTLTLQNGRTSIDVRVNASLKTNNAQVIVESLRAGRGPGPAQVILISDELADGRLVRILPAYEIKPSEAFLAYPSTKFMRPVVRAFTDFVIPKLRAVEGID
jgi:DNA-binding transcriptional LysR family regulator